MKLFVKISGGEIIQAEETSEMILRQDPPWQFKTQQGGTCDCSGRRKKNKGGSRGNEELTIYYGVIVESGSNEAPLQENDDIYDLSFRRTALAILLRMIVKE